MSSLHKLSTDYTPPTDREQRRVPLPITNLPVTAISEDMDPTAEIRTLIEQLQQTARDARGQIRAVVANPFGNTLPPALIKEELTQGHPIVAALSPACQHRCRESW